MKKFFRKIQDGVVFWSLMILTVSCFVGLFLPVIGAIGMGASFMTMIVFSFGMDDTL